MLAAAGTFSTADRVWLPLLRIGFGAGQSQSVFACHCRQHGCHAETCCDKVTVEAGLFVDRRRKHCLRFDDFLGLAQPQS